MNRLPLQMIKAIGPTGYAKVIKDWHNQHPVPLVKPKDRINGNEVIRRFVDGTVDHHTTAEKAINLLNELRQNVTPLYAADKALLALAFPKQLGFLMDARIAKTYCRQISADDVARIQKIVDNSLEDYDNIKDLKP